MKRTTEKVDIEQLLSAVRFTLDYLYRHPNSELLGYCQSSALADWSNYFLCKAIYFWLTAEC